MLFLENVLHAHRVLELKDEASPDRLNYGRCATLFSLLDVAQIAMRLLVDLDAHNAVCA